MSLLSFILKSAKEQGSFGVEYNPINENYYVSINGVTIIGNEEKLETELTLMMANKEI